MYQPGRFLYADTSQNEAARSQCDPVVARAIENVTARQPMEEWWALAPGVRSHAIYDEVRRLDRAWATASAEPAEDEQVYCRRLQMA